LNFEVIAEGVEKEPPINEYRENGLPVRARLSHLLPMDPGEIDAWVKTEKFKM